MIEHDLSIRRHHRGRHRQLPREHARLLRAPCRPAGRRAARRARTARAPSRCRSGRWRCCATHQGARAQDHGDDPLRPGQHGDRRPPAPLDARDLARPGAGSARGALRELQHQFMIPQAAVRVWGAAKRRRAALRAGRQRGREDLRHQPRRAVLRRELGLRGRELVRQRRSVMSLALIPLRPRGHRLRPARARLARPDALHARHGRGVPAPWATSRSAGAVAAAAAVLTAALSARCLHRAQRRHRAVPAAPGASSAAWRRARSRCTERR